jgi:chaperonin GroEL
VFPLCEAAEAVTQLGNQRDSAKDRRKYLLRMAKPQQTVFYSWQSDNPSKTNRHFIQSALDKAVKSLASKGSIAVDPVIDRDTRNVAGAPRIVDTIFSKIESAAIFVADVTFVAKTQGEMVKGSKALPNPNVMMELGYALKVLGDKRLVLIANTAFGRIEDAPFDLLGRRILSYNLAEKHLGDDAESKQIRKQVREQLQADLEGALEIILLLPPRDLNQLPAPLLILKGARSLREKAASSIGPRGGRITLIRKWERQRLVTRDGIAITAQLTDQDYNTRQGIELLSRASDDAREQAGDGAKTTMLLCYEMVNGGYEAVVAGELLHDVLNGMEHAVDAAVSYIQKQQRSLRGDEINNVAKTAGGAAAAKIVIEAFEKAKSEGIWMVQEADAPVEPSVEIQEGVVFPQGYLADEFANDPRTGNCVLEDCFVLVYAGRVYSIQQISSLLEKIVASKKSVLILAEGIEGEALALLVQNNKRKILSCVAVRAPGRQEGISDWLRDVAVITGADVLGGLYGGSIELADLSSLGKAERVIVGKYETQIIPGQMNEERIAIRLAQIRGQVTKTISYERDGLQNRLANLIGNTAFIRAGGRTHDEVLDNKYKITTAMRSVGEALANGYVLGGGLTYYNARKSLDQGLKLKSLNQGEKAGIKVIQKALEEPMRCLLATGRESIDDFQENSENRLEVGYNLVTKKYEGLREAGVWDSLSVTQCALHIALAHAKMILETTSWDTIKPDPPFL